MNNNQYLVQGAGLGLRRDILSEMCASAPAQVDFLEVAPENWIGLGGPMAKQLREMSERYPLVLHGLSLSIGSPDGLDETLVRQIRDFMRLHNCPVYSEHLTYCSDDGHLYDLMPIPFTEEAVDYVAERITRVQDIIGHQIAIENGSYYTPLATDMDEAAFINQVVSRADCKILLDINNVYVNSVNHRYDPVAFLKKMPADRIAYAHIAGHYNEADDLIVDTHGADVIPNVWELLQIAYRQFGVFPTLLERDFNIPPVADLLLEVDEIRRYQASIGQLSGENSEQQACA